MFLVNSCFAPTDTQIHPGGRSRDRPWAAGGGRAVPSWSCDGKLASVKSRDPRLCVCGGHCCTVRLAPFTAAERPSRLPQTAHSFRSFSFTVTCFILSRRTERWRRWSEMCKVCQRESGRFWDGSGSMIVALSLVCFFWYILKTGTSSLELLTVKNILWRTIENKCLLKYSKTLRILSISLKFTKADPKTLCYLAFG